MQALALVLLLATSLVHGAVSPVTGPNQCRKVPQEQVHQECVSEDVVISTDVEQCEDVVTTHCKERFVPVPLVPFRSSRIVGAGKSFVITGEGSHFSKREDVHHGLSAGRSCYEVKDKKCFNVPAETKEPNQACKNIASTILVEECSPIVKVQKVEKLTSVVPEVAPTKKSAKLVVTKSPPKPIKPKAAIPQVSVSISPKRKQVSKSAKLVVAKTTNKKAAKKSSRNIEIESMAAQAKAIITNVHKAVQDNTMEFSEARLKIAGMLQVLAEKTKDLDTNVVNEMGEFYHTMFTGGNDEESLR